MGQGLVNDVILGVDRPSFARPSQHGDPANPRFEGGDTIRNPALIFAIALAVGMAAQALARHLRIPGIVLLLLAGVLLGPEVGDLVRPDALGPALQLIVGMSVAIILFEGGLNLNLRRLRQEATTIRRLVTVGAVTTGVGGTLAARLIMGWSWELSALFGALVIVTGPTVMTPLLRRIKVNRNVHTILEGEGVLIDPVGAILAVVTFEFVMATLGAHEGSGAAEILGFPARIGLGAVVGLTGGALMALLLRSERLVAEEYVNVLILSLVLVVFEISEAVRAESGIMAAAMAGIVVGNVDTRLGQDLKEFKEQLTVMLIGLLFVLLAATVRLEAIFGLGWRGIVTIAVLMFVVRPADVAISTLGTNLSLRERTFIAWLAPRGIVAAAMASLFAQWLTEADVSGGEELQALVFLVIAFTVVLQGGTGPIVASLLRVRRKADVGYVLVGANELGRALARALKTAGEEVVLVDSSALACEEAQREGFRVVYGDAAAERTLRQAGVGYRRGVVAVTPNQAVNLLIARRMEEYVGEGNVLVALDRRRSLPPSTETDVGVLFGRAVEIDEWRHQIGQGLVELETWRYQGPGGTKLVDQLSDPTGPVLPLVVTRRSRTDPVSNRTILEPGDAVTFAWAAGSGEDAVDWLEANAWATALST